MANLKNSKLAGGKSKTREQFSGRFGMLATAIGSAVGLGNIWRFPYIVGQYGGGAFLIVYLLMVAIIGIPIMMVEFIIGREARRDAINSFRILAPGKAWFLSGVIGVLAAFFILGFYGVVAGWTLEYIRLSLVNAFKGMDSQAVGQVFSDFISHPVKPIITQLLVMAATGLVVSTGLQKGVEKAAKFMIPILVVLMVILNVQSFLLPGGQAGFDFLFKPDFSKLTKEGILAALGHAFFSLSLGMGIMITYGSYIPKKEVLGRAALNISLADTILALLAGIAIFPAVFAFGIEPSSGPGLVFISLPNIFGQMAGGYFFGLMFFVLLFLASLTSTISLLEVVVAFLSEQFKVERRRASLLATLGVSAVGLVASLSNGPLGHIKLAGDNIFDFLDKLTANYFLPLAAFISVIFVGWFLDRGLVRGQLAGDGFSGTGAFYKLFIFLIKFVVPLAVVVVFLFQTGKI